MFFSDESSWFVALSCLLLTNHAERTSLLFILFNVIVSLLFLSTEPRKAYTK